jgi:hypothetical protein
MQQCNVTGINTIKGNRVNRYMPQTALPVRLALSFTLMGLSRAVWGMYLLTRLPLVVFIPVTLSALQCSTVQYTMQ